MRGRWLVLVAGLIILLAARLRADQPWIAPTAEELAMTSQAQVPGASAVYLYREEVTDDTTHTHSFYVRLKVLTEGGTQFANVEILFSERGLRESIDGLAGRTIHADGKVISFTGKPYEKLIAKSGRFEVRAEVFTLPAVEVGSIIEYRYKVSYSDDLVEPPEWVIQGELFARNAHFAWQSAEVVVAAGSVAWSSRLPKGAEIKVTKPGRFSNKEEKYELDLKGVPPLVKEDSMPPGTSVGYNVSFYYVNVKTPEEFWTGRGQYWSESCNQFALPGKEVKAFVERTIVGSDTPDQKLKKLYDTVMQMENTDYSHTRGEREQKASGLAPPRNSDDLLMRRRGSSMQLTDLFVAMARAAGFKAYVAGVADRSERLFDQGYLSFSQLSEAIAIVALNDKDVYFDPGARFCEFKQLAWQHTLSGGLRQTDTGTALFTTPTEAADAARVDRVADLTLDEGGEGIGTVKMTSRGEPARLWREAASVGDATSLRADLRSDMEARLPREMEVEVTEIQNQTNPDKPLIVSYAVKGKVGVATGKRLLVPAHLFQVNQAAKFHELSRETPVMLPYASYNQDAIRLRLPAGMTVESSPPAEQIQLKSYAVYRSHRRQISDSIVSYRELVLGHSVIAMNDYADLRTFYSKLEAKDQESIVLIKTAVATSMPAAPGK